MASSPSNYLLFNFFIIAFLLLINPNAIEAIAFRPKALILPVSKDPITSQYLTVLEQRTPLVPVKLTLDLGGLCQWVNCEQNYVSSSYKPVKCGSSQCNGLTKLKPCLPECSSDPPRPGCSNNLCGFYADNPFKQTVFVNAGVGLDVVSIQSINGSKPGRFVSVPEFYFTCAITPMLEKLADGVQGMAGLGRHRLSLPFQFASAFSFHKKFALCLSSSGKIGYVFFGDSPNIDVSKSLVYTPLILNPVTTGSASMYGDPSSDYFIGVSSIKINGNAVPLNKTLLKINKLGFGGTKISTVSPYTVMQTWIYKAVINRFIKELAHVPRVPNVAKFGACFNSTYINSTRVGPAVPKINLVLHRTSVVWTIVGANSMVKVEKDVICVGIVDGGVNPRTSIVIGGHQLEDNLLQFDLASSKLGFSSSLLLKQTTCANFNFNSNA